MSNIYDLKYGMRKENKQGSHEINCKDIINRKQQVTYGPNLLKAFLPLFCNFCKMFHVLPKMYPVFLNSSYLVF